MFDWILKFEWNGLIGIALYWVPLIFCSIFYTLRTAEGYMVDKAAREKAAQAGKPEYYVPRETIGRILGRALVSVVPVANIWAALFDLSPKVFERAIHWLGRVFDQPLVPR